VADVRIVLDTNTIITGVQSIVRQALGVTAKRKPGDAGFFY